MLDSGSGQPQDVIKIGISSCLLGEPVRYDGGHKLDRFLVDTLGSFVEWVPVCPEVEMGLSVPRESMRLTGNPDAPRLIIPKSGIDYTDRMIAWAQQRLDQLSQLDLCGFIFKKNSPSSGLYRVRVYDEHGNANRTGTGIFPREVIKRFPLLPLEEEGRLNDLALRENFIERVFAYRRWLTLLQTEPTAGGLVKFHTTQKLTLMAHSVKHYKELGQLVAQAGIISWAELSSEYSRLYMEGMSLLGTRAKHVNVLQHLMGYLKRELPAEDKQELLALIDDYHRGIVPLIVPVTLLKHHLRRHPVPDWVWLQVYLNPYPKELMLRNHV